MGRLVHRMPGLGRQLASGHACEKRAHRLHRAPTPHPTFLRACTETLEPSLRLNTRSTPESRRRHRSTATAAPANGSGVQCIITSAQSGTPEWATQPRGITTSRRKRRYILVCGERAPSARRRNMDLEPQKRFGRKRTRTCNPRHHPNRKLSARWSPVARARACHGNRRPSTRVPAERRHPRIADVALDWQSRYSGGQWLPSCTNPEVPSFTMTSNASPTWRGLAGLLGHPTTRAEG